MKIGFWVCETRCTIIHCCLCLTIGLSFGRFQSEQNSQTHQNTSKTKVFCGKKRGEHHLICTFSGYYRTLSFSRSPRDSWVVLQFETCKEMWAHAKMIWKFHAVLTHPLLLYHSTYSRIHLPEKRKREREKCKLALVIDITVCWIEGIPNLARKTLKVSQSCSSIAKNPLHKLKNLQHIAECIKTFCTFSAILCAAFSPEKFSRLAGSARFLCCSLADRQKETGLF